MNKLKNVRMMAAYIAVLMMVACSGTPAEPVENTAAASVSSPETEIIVDSFEGLTIDDFFEETYKTLLLRSPQTITSLGIADWYGMRNDQLDDLSDDYIRETQAIESAILETLQTYDRDSLTEEEQLSYDVYEWYLEDQVARHEFMYHDYGLDHLIFSYDFSLTLFLEGDHAINSIEDAEDYITRLSQVERQVDQVMEGLKIREEMGIIPPDFIIDQTIGRMMWYLGTNRASAGSVDAQYLDIFTTFEDRLENVEGLDEAQIESLKEDALKEIERSFIPGYIKLIEHLQSIEDKADSDAGVWKLPDGDAYYEYLIHHQTSSDLTAEEIHQLGLAEVDRIHTEMFTAFEEMGYSTGDSLGSLRRQAMLDRGFFNGSSSSGKQDILDYYESILNEMDSRLMEVVDVHPEAEAIIIAEESGGAFYSPASVDGSRPGAFHAGVGGSQISIYNLATTAYHEMIPGHHFQIALAQELALPNFRAFEQYTGYAEGWALYSERLAWELGMYDEDPYSNIGRLELELLRAVRLVTDTGIHAMGWTRQEARDYMTSVIGDDSWNHEVDRYIVMPAQALSYKVGMLTILDLREQAMNALGDDFDLIGFHNALLTDGSLPLTILEDVLGQYIEDQVG